MAAGEWGQWGWTNLPCWNITLNVGANHSLDTLCPLCTIKQGPYFCRSVRIPLFKNYNSPPCMVKSSFSLIQGPFLLPLLLPRMLGAPARGKGPAQATSAQHQVFVLVTMQSDIQSSVFSKKNFLRKFFPSQTGEIWWLLKIVSFCPGGAGPGRYRAEALQELELLLSSVKPLAYSSLEVSSWTKFWTRRLDWQQFDPFSLRKHVCWFMFISNQGCILYILLLLYRMVFLTGHLEILGGSQSKNNYLPTDT